MRPIRPARSGSLFLAAVALAVSLPAAAGAFPYRIARRIAIAGDSPVGALAFAPDGNQVYAAAGDELRSFDVAAGTPSATVRLPGAGVGMATSPDRGGTLYVATRAPARLVTLSLHPLRIVSSVALRGGEPDALLYEPREHALYLASRPSHTVVRLDPTNGATVGVVRLSGDPAQMAGDDRGTVYVANAARDAVDVIDDGRMVSTGAIPTPDCHRPTGLALDPVGRRLFVACGDGIALVVDTDMGFAFEQLPIQKGSALQTVFAFHPNGQGGWKGGAFIAGDGPVVDAIRMNAFISYTGAGSMALPGRASALAVSSAAGQLWIALAPRAPGNGASAGESRQQAGLEILALGSSGGAR